MGKEWGIINKLSKLFHIVGGTAVGLVFLLALLQTVQPAAGSVTAVRYVRSDGSDGLNACTNPVNPCASIQQAVDQAATADEIRVAGGSYQGLTARQGITQVVYISKSVTILGGYNADFSDQEPQLNPTVVDAGHQGRVIYISSGTMVNLAGLRLVNGWSSGSGGGIHSQAARLVIQDTAVLSSQAQFGGGLYALNGQITLENSTISHNAAGLGGGGVRLYQSQTSFSGNTIANNTAVIHGGGLYLSFSSGRLENNRIYDNRVTTIGQGWGGGLHLHNSSVELAFNRVQGNSADTGGGLRLYQSPCLLDGNLIGNNQAAIGGGMSVEAGSDARLMNNALVDNTAVSAASGLRVQNANPTLQHTTIARNGGAEGSGLLLENGSVTLSNSIFAAQTIGVQNDGGTITLTATLWDSVVQPTVGSVQENLSQTGNAAFTPDGVHLTAVSAAIDNGFDDGVSTDIDAQPRPAGAGFDLGAHEWRSLTAVKTVSAEFGQPGEFVTYIITLSQPMTDGMNVLLTDTLPAAVTFAGPLSFSSGSGGFAGGVITWTGTVQTDTAVIIQWPVQLNAGLAPGTAISNQATVQDALGVHQSNTAVVIIPAKTYLPLVRHSTTNQ